MNQIYFRFQGKKPAHLVGRQRRANYYTNMRKPNFWFNHICVQTYLRQSLIQKLDLNQLAEKASTVKPRTTKHTAL
jgi:hypothetical protein